MDNHNDIANEIMAKRDMFTELMQGINDLKAARQGKITLRTTVVETRLAPQISPQEIISLRDRLGYSQPVFASLLRTSSKTLKNWEQGVSKPNTQAKVLLRLVANDPTLLNKIALM